MKDLVNRLHTLYGLLQDEQSKEIFQARFAIDMEWSIPAVSRLISLGSRKGRPYLNWDQPHKEALRKLNREHKKIILYGTAATGRGVAHMLESEHIDFYGFCGRRAKKYPDGLLGKPVLSPDELVARGDAYYVLPTVSKETYPEISEFLREHGYPNDHILEWVDIIDDDEEKQYFEFPELYRRGTAFIDGGCYDCGTSYRFAEWCKGAYSSILAFEPDPENYSVCREKIKAVPLPNFELINAGLASREGSAVFEARNAAGGHIVSDPSDAVRGSAKNENRITIRTAAIDDVVSVSPVGFIKMDVEGAELDALHGAKNTILRDKPLLAVCVYHLRGDTFAIMDHLHQLLPEYKFLLRHYTSRDTGTILYASVDL